MTMKVIQYTKYGPPEVLQLVDMPKPPLGDSDVLIKVHATTVTIGDTVMRSMKLPVTGWQRIMARLYLGLWKPRRQILGMELAGEIEAVGEDVTRFELGDAVFASTFYESFGGYAEYKRMPEDGVLAHKPTNLSFGEAAAITGGGQTALHCLQKAQIQPEQSILIYGASGAVGTNAVQIAKNHFDAQVIGVCSTGNVELVQSLGADKVIDYTVEDFTQSGETYDVIFDAVGKLTPAQVKTVRKLAGTYLNVHADSNGGDTLENLLLLKEIVEADKLKPIIDREYSFEQIVEAHHYVDQGHKKGNVVINL